MNYDISKLEAFGIDIKTGLEYTRAEDKYLSALQRYYKNFEKNKTNAAEFFSKKDWDNYMILVHALKSNSKMIGAMTLGEEFERLEMAARNHETDVIEQNHERVFLSYETMVHNLEEIGQMEDVKAAGEISGEEAKEVSKKVLDALEDFDDETALEQILILTGYPFRITQQTRLKEAKSYVEDFMYDEAAEIIKDLLPEIE